MHEIDRNELNYKIELLKKRFKPIYQKRELFPESHVLRTTQSIHNLALGVQANFRPSDPEYGKLQKLIVRSNLTYAAVKLESEQAQKS